MREEVKLQCIFLLLTKNIDCANNMVYIRYIFIIETFTPSRLHCSTEILSLPPKSYEIFIQDMDKNINLVSERISSPYSYTPTLN